MFSKDSPASSIKELVLFLKSQHSSNYVYRGQTKDYGLMLPSVYRKMNLTKWRDYFIVPDSQETPRVEIIRNSFIWFLLNRYGNIVGNYLAQQYLAQSACIDITEKIEIAAFFATKTYPDYTKSIDNEEELGVIYRFDKRNFDVNVMPSGVKSNPYDVNAKPGEYEVFEDDSSVSNIFVEKLDFLFDHKGRNNEKLFVIKSNLTTFSDLKPFLDQLEDNHFANSSASRPSINFMFNRPYQQAGGIIQPKYLCTYDGDTPEYSRDLKSFVGIEDIYGKYGMTAYYFRHRGKVNKHSREELWPPAKLDLTFATLCLMVDAVKAQYNLPDLEIEQIVDFGFPGNSIIFETSAY